MTAWSVCKEYQGIKSYRAQNLSDSTLTKSNSKIHLCHLCNNNRTLNFSMLSFALIHLCFLCKFILTREERMVEPKSNYNWGAGPFFQIQSRICTSKENKQVNKCSPMCWNTQFTIPVSVSDGRQLRLVCRVSKRHKKACSSFRALYARCCWEPSRAHLWAQFLSLFHIHGDFD